MTSKEEQIQAYKNFSFDESPDWKTYLNHLDPVPEGKVLEKKKRIWYRKQIDPNFDVFYDIEEVKQQNKENKEKKEDTGTSNPKPDSPPNPQNTQNPTPPPINVKEKFKEDIFRTEGYFKLGFFAAIIVPLIPRNLTHIAGLIACLFAVVRQNCAFPSLKGFLMKLLANEFVHNLLFIAIVWILEKKDSIFFLLPIALHFAIGASEFIIRAPDMFKFIIDNPKASYIMNVFRTCRMTVMEKKCQIELFIGAYLVFLYFVKQAELLNIFFYAGFLGFKCLLNPTMQLVIKG